MRICRASVMASVEEAARLARSCRSPDAAIGKILGHMAQVYADGRARQRKVTPGMRAQILALRKKGFSIRMVAARVGLSHTMVQRLAPGGRYYHAEHRARLAAEPPPGGWPFPKVAED